MPHFPRLGEFDTIKRLLGGAERQAHAMGDELPGPEHLLLAALALPDGTARAAFKRAGADPDALGPAIEAQHAAALQSVGLGADPGLAGRTPAPAPGRAFKATPQAQAAFRRAVELSAEPKPRRLLGAHVVVAVADLELGSAARAIRHLGIEPSRLGDAARQELGAPAR